MRTLIDLTQARLFAVPTVDGHFREGALIEGPQGWGEFGPDLGTAPEIAARWLTAATEPGTVGWPDPVRGQVPVAQVLPALDPEDLAAAIAAGGCSSVDLTVATHPGSLDGDLARVRAARQALGPAGAIRCDAGGRWDPDTAAAAITALDRTAGGLQYVIQPCPEPAQNSMVRARVGVPIAIPATTMTDASATPATSADILVLRCGPLGGARRALRIAERSGVPCVVAASGTTSVGLARDVALAGALPELPYACGLGVRWQLSADLVAPARSLHPVNGQLPVAPMPPGPDPELLRQFQMIDSERIALWRSFIESVSQMKAH